VAHTFNPSYSGGKSQEDQNLKKIFFVILGLEIRAFTLNHSTSPVFCEKFFETESCGTICPGWL
jgi:hypothetical protein